MASVRPPVWSSAQLHVTVLGIEHENNTFEQKLKLVELESVFAYGEKFRFKDTMVDLTEYYDRFNKIKENLNKSENEVSNLEEEIVNDDNETVVQKDVFVDKSENAVPALNYVIREKSCFAESDECVNIMKEVLANKTKDCPDLSDGII